MAETDDVSLWLSVRVSVGVADELPLIDSDAVADSEVDMVDDSDCVNVELLLMDNEAVEDSEVEIVEDED